jgi:hypothetical protein
MKIKDLIKHLETLDQEKELIVIATDPTGWEYGEMVDENSITEGDVYPCEDNGLDGLMIMPEIDDNDDDDDDNDDDDDGTVKCYIINMSC